jgi:hypothetical protein
MNFRQLAYGLLSFFPGIPESLYRGTGGTVSAEYCYCVWLRHLVLAHAGGMSGVPSVVVELGPGDSIGVGLAALLSGAKRYVTFDAVAHANSATNLRVFDDLVTLFRNRSPIPGRQAFPEIALDLESNEFPTVLISDECWREALSDRRVEHLRRVVSGQVTDPTVIEYCVSRNVTDLKEVPAVDFILSNAVMEHVSDLRSSYSAMAEWLVDGGYASHQIDFRSHSLFDNWDGHWACPDWLWALFMGRREYLLNREPFATHRRLAAASGLKEVSCARIERAPVSKKLASRFRNIDYADRSTCGGYLLLKKI